METKKSFFQKIFCSGDVNIYVNENQNVDENDVAESLIANLSEESNNLFTNNIFTNDIDSKDPIENGIGAFDSGNISTISVDTDYEEQKKYDALKQPIVSGFIFEDQDAQDAMDFEVKSAVVEKDENQTLDEEAVNLIEMLKNEGIEKEKEAEKRQQEFKAELQENKVESEIDMPLLQ